MPSAKANGLNIEYEIYGPNRGEAVLLIMGAGGSMVFWPLEFIERLVAKGYRVIRYDHRDTGLSEKLDDAGPPDMPAIFEALAAGRPAPVAYTLDDLAADAVGLLDALGIEKAHIVGASMGGMVAQLVAADHPEHTLSLTTLCSTSDNPELPAAPAWVMELLSEPVPDPATDREGYLAAQVARYVRTGSPGYPPDEAQLRERIELDLDRGYHPAGGERHFAAVYAAPDRRSKLKGVRVPSLVIHGEDDVILPVEGGRDTAAHLSDVELIVIPGMGHDLPPALFDDFADAIDRVAGRARAARS